MLRHEHRAHIISALSIDFPMSFNRRSSFNKMFVLNFSVPINEIVYQLLFLPFFTCTYQMENWWVMIAYVTYYEREISFHMMLIFIAFESNIFCEIRNYALKCFTRRSIYLVGSISMSCPLPIGTQETANELLTLLVHSRASELLF